MKRHGFHGLKASHGVERKHRSPGSIGACATPGRVFKGVRMAGRMGGVRYTVQNLTIQAVDTENNLHPRPGCHPRPEGRAGAGPYRGQDHGEEGRCGEVTTVDVLGRRRRHEPARSSCPADIFDVQANIPLMHQVVVAQLAAARQGTHKTKTRGEVAGGGKKPYKQKGTGRARQGSIRAPQFTGGGVVHGPVPRDYSQRTPKKMKAAALRGALSDRARDGPGARRRVLRRRRDAVDQGRAGHAAQGDRGPSGPGRARAATDELNWLSLRNEPRVHLIEADQLNTYDVLVADDVVFTKDALDEFLGVPAETTEEGGK